jgi:Cys-tRNA(Pro)/Cys-tRNA(Cys) deacylase
MERKSTRSAAHRIPADKIIRVAHKTNAARLLDQMGIHYELREYEVDPDDLGAETVAAKIGLPAEQVFQTLVARGDRTGICMAVIPGNAELDLKALAIASADRKIQLVPMKELLGLTGYVRGGVTALAAKKDHPVYVDETVELFGVDLDLSRRARPANPARPG